MRPAALQLRVEPEERARAELVQHVLQRSMGACTVVKSRPQPDGPCRTPAGVPSSLVKRITRISNGEILANQGSSMLIIGEILANQGSSMLINGEILAGRIMRSSAVATLLLEPCEQCVYRM